MNSYLVDITTHSTVHVVADNHDGAEKLAQAGFGTLVRRRTYTIAVTEANEVPEVEGSNWRKATS